MSKSINLNEHVHVKLTFAGLDAYLFAYPYKDRNEIINNDMWIREQFHVVMSTLNDFNIGFDRNKNSFTEIAFDNYSFDNILLPLEYPEIEELAIEAITKWSGRKDKKIVYRKESAERAGFIAISIDNLKIIEFRPHIRQGKYIVFYAFGDEDTDCESAPMSIDEVKHCLMSAVKNKLNKSL